MPIQELAMQAQSPIEDGPNSFLIIIGAMKSGTTTLYRLLSQHPQVARPSEKEPHFFSRLELFENGLSHYQKLWNWRPNFHKVAIEASTGYTKFPFELDVPERMASFSNCSFKFVYILRNPYERIESNKRHGLYNGWEESLDSGLSEEDYYINVSKYAMQIDQYRKYFDVSEILILTLDELKQDPEAVLLRVCEHAGLNTDFSFSNTNQIANPGRRYDRPQWMNKLEEGSGSVTSAIKSVMKGVLGEKRTRKLLHNAEVRVERGRYELTDEEKDQVLEYLSEDLRRLQSEYGVDVAKHWNINV